MGEGSRLGGDQAGLVKVTLISYFLEARRMVMLLSRIKEMEKEIREMGR